MRCAIRFIRRGPGAFLSLCLAATAFGQTEEQFTTLPASSGVAPGQATTLNVVATGNTTPTYVWRRNGTTIGGATNATLTVTNTQPADTGIYSAIATTASSTALIQPAIVGVSITTKIAGAAAELGSNILHPAGFVYDQILMQGAAAAVTADATQVMRLSFIDSNDDLVTVELSGAGTLSLVLDATSGPAPPAKYNQPGVHYMKGHAGIVIVGANETTNLAVFSVGRATATNQALFIDNITYDGFADLAFVAIASSNGKFGGLRASNARFSASAGAAGVFAPGVEFTGPVFVHDIAASGSAVPVLILGMGGDVRIMGGDLLQPNGRNVVIGGFTQPAFIAGSDSHGNVLPAQTNAGVLEQYLTTTGPQRALISGVVRTFVGPDSPLLMNLMVEGAASKTLLLRAMGPTLASLGLSGIHPDPALTIYNGSGAVLATNDNWGGSSALRTASMAAGGFSFIADDSKDAAALVTVPAGTYTVGISSVGNSSGIVLAEVYDMDANSRLVYFAARYAVSPGSVAVNGFTITGPGADILVRGLGPSLASYGVAGTLANPTLSLATASGATIATNDDWGGNAALAGSIGTAGLAGLQTLESAILLNLAAGGYVGQISGVANTSGVALFEVAQVDPLRAAAYPPAFTGGPAANQSAVLGSSVTFSAGTYVGKPAGSTAFQWRRNGVNIANATSATLTLTNVQPGDAGAYTVVLSNLSGSAIGPATNLTVLTPPLIVEPPVAKVVAAGGTASFAVTAIGTAPLLYQWYRGTTAIDGATGSTLTISNAQLANAGSYFVQVSNGAGAVTSTPVTLTVNAPPTIATHPAGRSLTAGAAVSFSVVATGSAPLSYQWRKGADAIPLATNATYGIPITVEADSGVYTCVVSNAFGTATSNPATLTVARNFAGTYFGTFSNGRGKWALIIRPNRTGIYLAFLNNPRAGIVANVAVADDGTFRTTSFLIQPGATVSSHDGRPVSAATTPVTLAGTIGTTGVVGTVDGIDAAFDGAQDTPGGATEAYSGLYQASGAQTGSTYTIVGSGGTVMALTVGSTTVDGGLGTIDSSGAFNLATDNTTVAGTVAPTTGTITAAITEGTTTTNVTGSATENFGPPVIADLPAAQAVAAGSTVNLAISATGIAPLSYQWRRNGANVTTATAATLNLQNLQPADAGVYSVAVTNPTGTTISQPVVVALASTSKVIGAGSEVASDIYVASVNNTFDQILLQGPAATVTADAGQVLRMSYIDRNDDIVQVEFSGAGALTLLLDNASGPAPPVKYNQPISYMKGDATVILAGANETTNVSLFTVGRGNAFNQALFSDNVTYDGRADVALLAITSTDGKFAGLRTANTSYSATLGFTGVYAPGVQFSGPVYVGNIGAADTAIPLLMIGGGPNTQINGGNLLQSNAAPVRVSGLTALQFVNGSTSHLVPLPAQANQARLEQDGIDVTAQVVVNPTP